MADMTAQVLIAAIAVIPGTLAAVATLIVVIRNDRKTDNLVEQTDGLTKALVESESGKALMEGHVNGVKDEQARNADAGGTTVK